MSETKERWPDSTMNEQAKQQLREIIDYKKKDDTYSGLISFKWTTYKKWSSLNGEKTNGYEKTHLFLVKNADGYWWMKEEPGGGNQKTTRPPTKDGAPGDENTRSFQKQIQNYVVALYQGHVVLSNPAKQIHEDELQRRKSVRASNQKTKMDNTSGFVDADIPDLDPPGAPRNGYIYIGEECRGKGCKKTGSKRIVLLAFYGGKSRGVGTKFVSIFLPQMIDDTTLPQNITKFGRQWVKDYENYCTVKSVGPWAFQDVFDSQVTRELSTTVPPRNQNFKWKDSDQEQVKALIKEFNAKRFELLIRNNETVEDILFRTKFRLARLMSFGGKGFKVADDESVPAVLRQNSDTYHHETPLIFFPSEQGKERKEIINSLDDINLTADIGTDNAIQYRELLECVDNMCTVLTHSNGALVSDIEKTNIEENSIDKILWPVPCRLCKRGKVTHKSFLHVWYILIAAIIAAAGLGINSAPTVVASMLVSSMMEPIKGMATALRFNYYQKKGWERALRRAGAHFLLLAFDIGLCLLVGVVAGFIFTAEQYTEDNCTLTEQFGGKTDCVANKIQLVGEMHGRGEYSGIAVAALVATVSAMALVTADKSDNKSALVGIGISASLLPPAVNAGMLWAMWGDNYESKTGSNLGTRGWISLALTGVNIGIILLVWTVGYCKDDKEKYIWCCKNKRKCLWLGWCCATEDDTAGTEPMAVALELELVNPIHKKSFIEDEENTPLLRF